MENSEASPPLQRIEPYRSTIIIQTHFPVKHDWKALRVPYLPEDRGTFISKEQVDGKSIRVPQENIYNAMAKVISLVRETVKGITKSRKLCILVTLNVKNAINSDPWLKIDSALIIKDIPGYLLKLNRSYLSDRFMMYEENSKVSSRAITCGVPQGLVLGPILWNIM